MSLVYVNILFPVRPIISIFKNSISVRTPVGFYGYTFGEFGELVY